MAEVYPTEFLNLAQYSPAICPSPLPDFHAFPELSGAQLGCWGTLGPGALPVLRKFTGHCWWIAGCLLVRKVLESLEISGDVGNVAPSDADLGLPDEL